ncbi:MAG: histidine kinase [Gemmatimonadaceae bacterium]|nr:histidine kinase [Gemmatimonadaceae bacterium]
MATIPPVQAARPSVRFVVVVAVMVCTAYLSVFTADAHQVTVSIVLDAVANTLALALVALGVRWFTDRVPWSRAGAWWFLPVHVLAALAAAQLSVWATATALGLATWVQTSQFTPTWLGGRGLHWQLFTVVFGYAAVAGSCYALQVAADAHDARSLRQEAELARLRARLDPHVLLNTLHSLVELLRSDDAAAEEAIERFGRVVRYVSAPRDAAGDLVPLQDEWSHLEDYLHLEQLRLGDRLQVVLRLDDAVSGVRIPAGSLQPLVENAIVHGIGPRPGPGCVSVHATQDGRDLRITVADDGVGTTVPATPGSGSGLSLVQARLRAYFGTLGSLRWGPAAGGLGWQVSLRLPVTTT